MGPTKARQAGEEIEITPEMIEAGVDELYCFDMQRQDDDEMREAIASVFNVMLSLFQRDKTAR